MKIVLSILGLFVFLIDFIIFWIILGVGWLVDMFCWVELLINGNGLIILWEYFVCVCWNVVFIILFGNIFLW